MVMSQVNNVIPTRNSIFQKVVVEKTYIKLDGGVYPPFFLLGRDVFYPYPREKLAKRLRNFSTASQREKKHHKTQGHETPSVLIMVQKSRYSWAKYEKYLVFFQYFFADLYI